MDDMLSTWLAMPLCPILYFTPLLLLTRLLGFWAVWLQVAVVQMQQRVCQVVSGAAMLVRVPRTSLTTNTVS